MSVARERNRRSRSEARARARGDERLNQVLIGLVIVLAILALRLIHLQVIARGHYLDVGGAIVDSRSPGEPRRGSILARDLQPLAESSQVYSLFADPKALAGDDEHPDLIPEAATAVARALGMDRRKIITYLREEAATGARDRPIKRLLSDKEHAALEKISMRGLRFKPEWMRTYHHGMLACHVLGRCSRHHEPLEGVEKQWDFVLAGSEGSARSDLDAFGRWIPGQDASGALPTKQGRDVVLTIDLALQAATEMALDVCMDKNRPEWVSCVVLDANTSEVLACASRPGFNPAGIVLTETEKKARKEELGLMLNNALVQRLYEPGSVFKVLLAAAVIETKACPPDQTFYCGGVIQVGGKSLSCWPPWDHNGGHHTCDLTRMLVESCNVVAAQFAQEVGPTAFYNFLRGVGIGVPVFSGMHEEAKLDVVDEDGNVIDPALLPPEDLTPRDLANLGFGQGVDVTTLQLANAIASVINGGRLMQPHIVKAVLNSANREVIRAIEPVQLGTACSPETSAAVRRMMGKVVTEGTGRRAAIHPDFPVGGKTGTAEQWDRKTKGYKAGNNIVSFVMVAPLDDPRFVILVTAASPKIGEHGSDVAAPVARSVAITALRDADLLPVAIELEVDTASSGGN